MSAKKSGEAYEGLGAATRVPERLKNKYFPVNPE
jgi:hypothetical protein